MTEQVTQLQDVKIRWYVPKDLDGVKPLIKALAQQYNDNFDDYFFKNFMQVRLLDASAGTFVAEKDGKIVGCAFANTERDPRGVLWGQISNVNISEKFQGKGLGAALVDEAIQFLSAFNIPGIWANLNPNNEPMKKLFEKREFVKWLKVMEKNIEPLTSCVKGEDQQLDVNYRAMVQNDVPDVKNLIKNLSELFNQGFEPYWFDISIQKFFQDPAARVFVAEKSGKIVGVAFAESRRDPMGSFYGYISNIMIDESARGKGVGNQLLHHAASFLCNLNINKIWANVNDDNPAMEKLFVKAGFTHKFTVVVKMLNFGAAC